MEKELITSPIALFFVAQNPQGEKEREMFGLTKAELDYQIDHWLERDYRTTTSLATSVLSDIQEMLEYGATPNSIRQHLNAVKYIINHT